MTRIAPNGLVIAVCLLALTAEVLSAPALPGGWEFAKWGMTPAQVRAASHGAVRVGNPGYDTMRGEYAMATFKFDVTLDYKPPSDDPGNTDPARLGLDAVLMDLDVKSGACTELAAYLKTVYGKPNRTFARGPAGMRWSRKELGDVQYSTWDQQKTCTVMYMPFGGHDR